MLVALPNQFLNCQRSFPSYCQCFSAWKQKKILSIETSHIFFKNPMCPENQLQSKSIAEKNIPVVHGRSSGNKVIWSKNFRFFFTSLLAAVMGSLANSRSTVPKIVGINKLWTEWYQTVLHVSLISSSYANNLRNQIWSIYLVTMTCFILKTDTM